MADERTAKSGDGQHLSTSPSISLPKGGGAVRGMGEKFAAHPVTGTGSMSVPLAVSPGRAGVTPQLSLAYDSAAGNGPFGFGWSLDLPRITRKTEKGLPQYHDALHSDTFVLWGAEHLVPTTAADGSVLADTVTAAGHTIHRYRPRVEAPFARIERWTRDADGDVHWRSLSPDNVLSVYGADAASRIADPDDARRVFSWLLSETRDDKGNAIVYDYKAEDGAGVDLTLTHERNRGPANDPRRTANRYLKRVRYGNRVPLLDAAGRRPVALTAAQRANAGWMFEVVLDYGEHDTDAPTPGDAGAWRFRSDPFSSYRARFEVRTTRICRRVLMFHHFPDAPGVGDDCLVRSTDFIYTHDEDPTDARNPLYTFLKAVTQVGYQRAGAAGYVKRRMPPLEFAYTQPVVQDAVHEVDAESLENLPVGADGTTYRWIDLHGEGIPGLLAEQGDAWFYKRNVSPIGTRPVEFRPTETVAQKPAAALLAGGHAQFMDLAGDGLTDLVLLEGSGAGFFEHDEAEGWKSFRPFPSRLTRDVRDPNARLVDLNGDGLADLLCSEDDAFVWHASLGEDGFGPATRVPQRRDEELGPRLLFSDGTESIYLSDMSGDGLADIVRVSRHEIAYWPNLGYGAFGAKVTMDGAPCFDNPEQFDHRRIRLADIDGSGTTDIIYLHREGVRLYFNQSGNSWSAAQPLRVFPRVDDIVSIVATDLLGNGTACLVWSSPLPRDDGRRMRYVDLMGGQKPHLLVASANNLGAETHVDYASSTKFYLRDKYAGTPWITRLPFPVHVIERVVTLDRVSRSRFVTRYSYHHGYFDGEEREFRGFGRVEQTDTEELAALTAAGTLPPASNVDSATHVPPVLTKSWYHTGVYVGRDHVSDYFADSEYYREPGATPPQARAQLLADTTLPPSLTIDEEREACRALKGALLRQEIYGLDDTPAAAHPYSVTEQSYSVRRLQARGVNRHAVFYTHERERLSYQYERDPSDPRVQHTLTLDVDGYGTILKRADVGYGRRQPDATLLPQDAAKQTLTLVSYAEHLVTNAIDDVAIWPHEYRKALRAETRTYHLTGYPATGPAGRYLASDFVAVAGNVVTPVPAVEIEYEAAATNGRQRRLIELARVLYRPDDLGASANTPLALLPLRSLEPLAITGEEYRLAFTPGLLASVFVRAGQPLLPNPAAVLAGGGPAGGGYVRSQELVADGRFPNGDPNDRWWIPGGRVFLSPNGGDSAAQELAHARQHFFLTHRLRDPFHTAAVSTESVVTYDAHDLLVLECRDAVGNRTTVGERLANGTIDPATPGHDYRVLQPWCVTDPNRNRTQVAFDVLGMVVGTAVLGKPGEVAGDSLAGFVAELSDVVALSHLDDPLTDPSSILGGATTRMVYDLFAYRRTMAQPDPQPVRVYTLARTTHLSDLAPAAVATVGHTFAYSDGFGRVVQQKLQAEPAPAGGGGGGGAPVPRWVGSGWIIYNNKGKPVRQYEPFFDATHHFAFGVMAGVSPIVFYDPLERVVATIYPDHSYEKVVFDPWVQVSWDRNDTVSDDPRTDADIARFTKPYFDAQPVAPLAPWQTWLAQRAGGALGAAAAMAATKAAAHGGTPLTTHLDTMGRPFLTLAHDGFRADGSAILFASRLELDVEGNQRAVRDAVVQGGDALGRVVMRYDYDLRETRIRQSSMDGGTRWMLDDAAGKPIRTWDSRGHALRYEYDPLRRPVRTFVTGEQSAAAPNLEVLTERRVYGEQHPAAASRNLLGKLYLLLDQAGSVASETLDFKGNVLSTSRRVAADYASVVDWSGVDAALAGSATVAFSAVALDGAMSAVLTAETFVGATSYDALNRIVTLTTPHSAAMPPSTIRPVYNEANLLERLEVNVRGAVVAGGGGGGALAWTSFIDGIDYDAKGQRLRVDYGNGTTSLQQYDPLTGRLVSLESRRDPGAFPADCPAIPAPGWGGCYLQDLTYTYDPMGNVVLVRDDAQQTIFFRNKRVEPSAEYTYDPLYRLTDAIGREHLGQVGGAPVPSSFDDAPRVHVAWSANDGLAMGTYSEKYLYDEVGNFLELRHVGTDPANPGWTRHYAYDEASLLEDGTAGTTLKTSNRLSRTSVGNNDPAPARYTYDAHGNQLRLPHLAGAFPAPNLTWDFRDRPRRAALGGGGGTVYYTYDADGRRVRKVWEKSPGVVEERLYLGGFEIFRRRSGADRLERETLHVMDDTRRVALVETRTLDTANADKALPEVTRFQLGNPLGSTTLELDEHSQIVSYEEFYPYGSTSYQAVRGLLETPKRYRLTGKERDEETGLYYYGARYYASWIGRWISTDPKGVKAGLNPYLYVAANPARLFDPDGKDWRDSLSWTQRAALWVDEEIVQESPVATGLVKNMEKRGEALVNAPHAIAEKYEKEGLTGIGKGVVLGVGHLVTDTVDAAGDVGYYGAQAALDSDPKARAAAKEKVASRSLDIVLNIADIVTLADGAGAAKNAVVGGGKALAAGGKTFLTVAKDGMEVLAEGGKLAPATGVMAGGGGALVATGDLSVVAADAVKGGGQLAMTAGKNAGGSTPKPHDHHLATNKNSVSPLRGGPWTPKFRPFFEGAGLDINTAKENIVSILDHAGPHPEAYHQYVFDRLTQATEGLTAKTPAFRDAVIKTLNEIAEEAKTPGSQVNTWLTKK